MTRDVFWRGFVTVALLIGTGAVDRALAQQLIDPSPAVEEPESDEDLPLRDHSLVDEKPESDVKLPSRDHSLVEEPESEVDLPVRDHSSVVEKPYRDFSRPYFGVTFDPQIRNAAVARSVIADSPADQAGVLAGDTVVAVNGQKTETYDEVLQVISRLKPGDVLDFEVTRRVSVRARAVLEGMPLGMEHSTGYRAEAESLPAPGGYQDEPTGVQGPLNRAPSNVNAPRRPQGFNAPEDRNTELNADANSNRTNNSNERDRVYRRRGGFFRRGR